MITDINDIIYGYLEDIILLNKFKKCLVQIKKKRKYIICNTGSEITSSRVMYNRFVDSFNRNNVLHITRYYKWTSERDSILIDNNHKQTFIEHYNMCGNF